MEGHRLAEGDEGMFLLSFLGLSFQTRQMSQRPLPRCADVCMCRGGLLLRMVGDSGRKVEVCEGA